MCVSVSVEFSVHACTCAPFAHTVHYCSYWVIATDGFVVETTLVGVALSGLSHLVHITNKSQFVCALIKGLGANLGEQSRLNLVSLQMYGN